MTGKFYLRSAAAAACLTALGGTAFAAPKPDTAGLVQILLEEDLRGWRLSSAESETAIPTLALSGKLVLQGDQIVGGELASTGTGMRLLGRDGRSLDLEDLAFKFDDGRGEVIARSEASSALFTLGGFLTQPSESGDLMFLARMTVADLAERVERPDLRGAHAATLLVDVDASMIRFLPVREKLDSERVPHSVVQAGGGVPDVTVYSVGEDGGDTNDIHYWGQANGTAAYSIATQSCNAGSASLDWYDSGGNVNHPVIAQNMFRYADGRLEQVGQSWLKHGFCAVNELENGCSPCATSNCDTLGVGCADTYWATLNDGRSGGTKSFVNATTGVHAEGSPAPSGNNTIRGRLQVAVSDIDPVQNPGASYFIESQYVAADDAAAGASRNNASYRPVDVNAVNNITGGGNTVIGSPAIFAWKDMDPAVVVRPVSNQFEADGMISYYYIAYKAESLGGGLWSYEYALQNLTSDQAARAFDVTVPDGVNVTDIYFHDVDYHSGDPYDGTDWAAVRGTDDLVWSTDDFATNANANALRWGTLYNFGFVADTAPGAGDINIGLFKPGTGTSVKVKNSLIPSAPPEPRVQDDRDGGFRGVGSTSGGSISPPASKTKK